MKKWISHEEATKNCLKDPEFKKHYDALEAEFDLIKVIHEFRVKNSFTQKELAQKIGTKQSAISRLESGNYNPSLKFLKKVAKALGKKLTISFK